VRCARRGLTVATRTTNSRPAATRAGKPDLTRRAAAEALAAFALVFAGCGAIVANAQYEDALGAARSSAGQ
jgi:hypothetical protein